MHTSHGHAQGEDTSRPGQSGAQPRKARALGTGEQARIGLYRFVKTLGRGTFAKVKLARHMITGRQVAVKIIDKRPLTPAVLDRMYREVRILKSLDHPNIVKLFDVIDTDKALFLIMEYASGGEVLEYLLAKGRLKEEEARGLFQQIVSAVCYCHQKHVVHRDLKAENLLLDEHMNIKLADFGLSNQFGQGRQLDTFCGSPPYAAPELFQHRKYDGPEVDVWSLGVILYTLVTGSHPFPGNHPKEIQDRVLQGKYRIPLHMSSDCENLLRRFLVLNPKKRGTLEEIKKHRWMSTRQEEDDQIPSVGREPNICSSRRSFWFGNNKRATAEGRTPAAPTHSLSSATSPGPSCFPRCLAIPRPLHHQPRELPPPTHKGPPASPGRCEGSSPKVSDAAWEIKAAKPRSLRFTWNMKTTSSKDPSDILREIREVLDANNCIYSQKKPFVLFCVHEDGYNQNILRWEMEVCKLPRMCLYGVKFKPISKKSTAFKTLTRKIANELKL